MTKEYFQDIVPPTGGGQKKHKAPASEEVDTEDMQSEGGRGIRNIGVSRTRQRMNDRLVDAPRMRLKSPVSGVPHWVMGIAGAALVVLVGGYFLFAFRQTTVTVVPRTQSVTFDAGTPFNAFPVTSSAAGALGYTVETRDLEESATATVPEGSKPQQPHKAAGTVTAVNSYSAQPVRLVKNTRFQTPDGLIFRAPSDIVIPGKKGANPGTVSVTLIADEDGSKYNVGPVDKLTVPGLKSTPAMYAGVYAKATAAMTGGADATAGAAAINTTISDLRTKLQKEAEDAATSLTGTSTIAFPGLIQVTYQDVPAEGDSSTSVTVKEQAHVQIPVFDRIAFSRVVAQLVTADAETGSFDLVGGTGFGSTPTASSTALGTDPLVFAMHGSASLVWEVDTGALATALAGRDQGAFQTIITGFPGVQEAHARIEPFWKKTFPSDPKKIVITVQQPPQAQ